MARIANETPDGKHDHSLGCTAPTYLGAGIATVLTCLIAVAVWWLLW